MRKTIRNGIDRRAVYKFRCTGPCNRVKFSYVYERAKSGVCLTCSKKHSMMNQDSLFPEGFTVQEMTIGEIAVINPEVAERLKKAIDEINKLRSEAIDEFCVESVEITQEVKVNENGAATHVRVLSPDGRVLRDWMGI